MGLVQARLDDARNNLEKSDEKNFRFEQGRIQELRILLDLENSAKALLDRSRLPSGNTDDF